LKVKAVVSVENINILLPYKEEMILQSSITVCEFILSKQHTLPCSAVRASQKAASTNNHI